MLLNCGFVEHYWQSLSCKEIKPVNPKENQSWIFIGRTDIEAEAPILWLPDAKNLLTGKYPHAGKDWRWEEKGTTEDEMVGWHHLLNGHEFEHALGVGDGQGSLACCSPWGHKALDMTERQNWTELGQLKKEATIQLGWMCFGFTNQKVFPNYFLVNGFQNLILNLLGF